jgi:hypothetical protein
MKDDGRKASCASMAQGCRVRKAPKRTRPAPFCAIDDIPEAETAQLEVVSLDAKIAATSELATSEAPPPEVVAASAPDPAPSPAEAPAPTPRHRTRSSRASVGRRIIAVTLGMSLVAGGAFAATNWVVGLAVGSSGEGQSASVANLTVSAVASPAATNLLYPGGTGDVVLTISNPNPYPVTVTGVNLPTNVTYATGYTTSALTTTQTGCIAATPSDVIWNFSTASSGSAHTLTSPVTVGPSGNANNPLTITLTNDASMTAAAPAACENTYFSMPSLTAISASGGAATVTTSPVVDGWTS